MKAPVLQSVESLEHGAKKFVYKVDRVYDYVGLVGMRPNADFPVRVERHHTAVEFNCEAGTITVIGNIWTCPYNISAHLYCLIDQDNGDIVAIAFTMRDIKKFAKAYDRDCDGDWCPTLYDRGKRVERWKY